MASVVDCPPILAVVGASAPGPEAERLAWEVGREIAARGATLVCGGGGGIMERAASGARHEGGATLGIMPGSSPAETRPNPSIDIPVFTGLGQARNLVVVLTARAVVAVGGGWGTLSEIALAVKHGRPVVLLASWELVPPPGVDTTLLLRAATPQEAVSKALAAAGSTTL
jgi:uncharacterized protein (TIGR00725 family)